MYLILFFSIITRTLYINFLGYKTNNVVESINSKIKREHKVGKKLGYDYLIEILKQHHFDDKISVIN